MSAEVSERSFEQAIEEALLAGGPEVPAGKASRVEQPLRSTASICPVVTGSAPPTITTVSSV